MGHRIFSQGSLDGACSLYAIMNAFKALTYPELETHEFIYHKPITDFGRKKWEYLVRTCPQTVEMLAGIGPGKYIATVDSSRREHALEKTFNNLISMSFDLLSDTDYQFNASIIELDKLTGIDFKTSVVILAIDKDIPTSAGNSIGNHFICIVGKDVENFYIICSATLAAVDSTEYTEYQDNNSKRYFNNKVKIEDINKENLGKAAYGIFEIKRV